MRVKMIPVVLLHLLLFTGFAGAGEITAEETVVGLPLTGQEAVEFLSTAEVTSKPEDFDDLAITSPRRMELSDGSRSLRVIFKDENTLHRGTHQFGDGRQVPMVKDSYLHEIAAFELAQMLGLDMVPPCVERKLYSRRGSLCLWVENAMTEADRKERGLEPPGWKMWNEQMFLAHLFQQLISDQDFPNIRNLIVDSNFRIYKVDSSMSFYPERSLRDEDQPTRFSRQFLEALESLDQAALEERLKPWTGKGERKTLWARRNRILELATQLVAELGEKEVLY